ncbi:MAG: hypothetical protein ABI091_11570 [Ferruginibacter sp.]
MATSQKTNDIIIPAWYVYNVKMVCGIQPIKVSESCAGDPTANNGGAILSRGIYSTEVNIFNYNEHVPARIIKYYVPLVRENKPIGFEPNQQQAKRIAEIVLKPNCATADDCCGIAKILKVKNILNIGFLKIVSSVDLSVTAVYTAADLERNSVVSIDVEEINAKTLHYIPSGD